MPTGPDASLDFALATNIAKKRGFNDFHAGAPGKAARGKIAEDIAAGKRKPAKKPRRK